RVRRPIPLHALLLPNPRLQPRRLAALPPPSPARAGRLQTFKTRWQAAPILGSVVAPAPPSTGSPISEAPAMKLPRTILPFVLLCGLGMPAYAQPSPAGEWVGGYESNGNYVPLQARFKSEGDGLSATVDLPTRREAGVALTRVSFRSPDLHFE